MRQSDVISDPVFAIQIGHLRLVVLLEFYHLLGLLCALYVSVRRHNVDASYFFFLE